MGYEQWQWRLRESGKETGPFTFAELQRRFAAQEIDGNTEACPQKLFGGWQRLDFFFPVFKTASPLLTDSVQPQGSATLATELIERRSGWATFLRVVGCVNILVGLIGFVASDDNRIGGILLAIGLVGVIQSFFFAFLVDVFTDIRWFVKKIADERSPDA
ncbi:MAG: DUF4339 domain-containing protein [Verrucomicrobia bacterium]|nr:DUF4339 domain-containing protein [Verrucomicrobiota bacterium]